MFCRYELVKTTDISMAFHPDRLRGNFVIVPLLLDGSKGAQHLTNKSTVALLSGISGAHSDIVFVEETTQEAYARFIEEFLAAFDRTARLNIKRPSIVILCPRTDEVWVLNGVPDGEEIEHLLVDVIAATKAEDPSFALKLLEQKHKVFRLWAKNSALITQIFELFRGLFLPKE